MHRIICGDRGAGDFSFTTALLNLVANSFAVVALVTEQLVRITVDLLHQGREGSDIVRLPRRNHDADRQALGVGACVDLGREAAARTAERVALGPPFPPAAQWCARMMVASIICSVASDN